VNRRSFVSLAARAGAGAAVWTVAGLGPGTAALAGVLGRAVFRVTDFGAKGDGAADDTRAIEATILAAVRAGGGQVVFPGAAAGSTRRLSYRITRTIAVPSHVSLAGPGQVFSASDITLVLVRRATAVVIADLELDGRGARGVGNLINVEGSDDVVVARSRLLGARHMGLYVHGSSRVEVRDNYVYRPCNHGIVLIDGVRHARVSGNRVIEPGYGHTGLHAGKGIGVQSSSASCEDLAISSNEVTDAHQISIECWGPKVTRRASVTGNKVRQSDPRQERFGISLNNTEDSTVSENEVHGCGIGLEAADGTTRSVFSSNRVSGGRIGIQSSGTKPPIDNQFLLNTVDGCDSHGIEIYRSPRTGVARNTVRNCGGRGIFLNTLGPNAGSSVEDNIVTGCGGTGVYLYKTYGTAVRGNTATGNNTTAAASESSGIAVNAESVGLANTLVIAANRGEHRYFGARPTVVRQD
jgi:parallel beta-helix repeat protein